MLEVLDLTGAEVIGSCDLPNVGARNWTLVLWKNSVCMLLTAKPSLQFCEMRLWGIKFVQP